MAEQFFGKRDTVKVRKPPEPIGSKLPAVIDTTGMSLTDPEMAKLFEEARGPGMSARPSSVPGPFEGLLKAISGLFGRR